MTGKREEVLTSIEEHLRHAIDEFYTELEAVFQPLHAFCTAQRRLFEPKIARVKQLASRFAQISDELGPVRAGSSVSITRDPRPAS